MLKSDLTNALTKITGLETELRRVSAAVAQRPSSQAVPASVDTTQLERRFHSLGFRINELHQLVAGFNTRVERLELAARKAVSLPAVVLQDSEVDSPMAIARVGQSKESDKTIRELRERIAQTEAAIREVRRDFVEDSKGRAGAKPQVSAPATASPVAEGIGAKQILPIPEALARFGESVIAAGGSMPLDVGIAIADELRRLSMRIRLALGAGTAGTVIPSTPPVQDGVLHGIKLNPPVQDVVSMAELSKRLIELKTLNPKMKMEEMAEILTVEFPHNSMGRINARYVETLFTAIYRDHPELKSRSRSKEAVSKGPESRPWFKELPD